MKDYSNITEINRTRLTFFFSPTNLVLLLFSLRTFYFTSHHFSFFFKFSPPLSNTAVPVILEVRHLRLMKSRAEPLGLSPGSLSIHAQAPGFKTN